MEFIQESTNILGDFEFKVSSDIIKLSIFNLAHSLHLCSVRSEGSIGRYHPKGEKQNGLGKEIQIRNVGKFLHNLVGTRRLRQSS